LGIRAGDSTLATLITLQGNITVHRDKSALKTLCLYTPTCLQQLSRPLALIIRRIGQFRSASERAVGGATD